MSLSRALKLLDDGTLSVGYASDRITGAEIGTFGHIDRLDLTGLVGWTQNRPNTPDPLNVVFTFGRHLIGSVLADHHRADIEAITGNARAGFELSFKDDNVRAAAINALASLVVCQRELGAPTGEIELTVFSVATTANEEQNVYQLSGDLSRRKNLAEWLQFFDCDECSFVKITGLRSSNSSISPNPMSGFNAPKVIAFYLPQFHPTPQNNDWWGPGFTEWTSVSTSKPYFDGHVAPNLPADLGFYDIRLKEVRAAQAVLAKSYGIYGFCYYYYWFSGKRILERPLELLLQDREPDLPYCLCWANETWSRRWDGSETEILQHQSHDADTDREIFHDLLPFFDDPRYIRIDGKPLLLVYRITLMPEPARFVAEIRKMAAAHGLPGLHICAVRSFGITDGRLYGADSSVEFPPHGVPAKSLDKKLLANSESFLGEVYDYESLLASQPSEIPATPCFPGVMPRWDNTARKKETGNVYHRSSPEAFEAWVRIASRRTLVQNPNAPLLFVNSWNEWGEGAHLEPDRRYGRQYLEALSRGATLLNDDASVSNSSAGYIQSLRKENAFISARLAQIHKLKTGIHPLSGAPIGINELSQEVCAGSSLDRINGSRSSGSISIRKGDGVYFTGWFVGSKELMGTLYLVMRREIDRKQFFVPIFDRVARADVAEFLESPLRSLDAGFVLDLATERLDPGFYTYRFIEATNKSAYHSSEKLTLEVW